MADLKISDSSIPDLTGQTAVVTGGAGGIGHAAVEVLAKHGAKVHVLDVRTPDSYSVPSLVEFKHCDLSSWAELSNAFQAIGGMDMVFANAGVLAETPIDAELETDAEGGLVEPRNGVVDINFKATLNTLQLAVHFMKKQGSGGRIVLTSSSTAYMPDVFIPLYSATKLAVAGLVRSYRHILPKSNITINAVAPGPTRTPMTAGAIQEHLDTCKQPMSSAHMVALALVYSATAQQDRPVEIFAKIGGLEDSKPERWNGRVILTYGDTCTEIEQSLSDTRAAWFGKENEELNINQQAALLNV